MVVPYQVTIVALFSLRLLMVVALGKVVLSIGRLCATVMGVLIYTVGGRQVLEATIRTVIGLSRMAWWLAVATGACMALLLPLVNGPTSPFPASSTPSHFSFNGSCANMSVWHYRTDRELVALIDRSLQEPAVWSSDLSIAKDTFRQDADTAIDYREAIILPWIALRDDGMSEWITQKDCGPPADGVVATAACEAEVDKKIDSAFGQLQTLSSACESAVASLHGSLDSLLSVVGRALDATGTELQKREMGREHQQGLVNIKDRIGQARAAATKLRRSLKGDVCMRKILETMEGDWDVLQAGVTAEEAERLRRSWIYITP